MSFCLKIIDILMTYALLFFFEDEKYLDPLFLTFDSKMLICLFISKRYKIWM